MSGPAPAAQISAQATAVQRIIMDLNTSLPPRARARDAR